MKSGKINQPALFNRNFVTFNQMTETGDRRKANSNRATETLYHSTVKGCEVMVTRYQMTEQGYRDSVSGNQMPGTGNQMMVTGYHLSVNGYQAMETPKNRQKTRINYINN